MNFSPTSKRRGRREEAPPVVRIRSRLSKPEAEELRRLRLLFGFRSDYEFVQASVRLFLRLLQNAEQQAKADERSDAVTIARHFSDLADAGAPVFARLQKGRDEDHLRLLFDDSSDGHKEETDGGRAPEAEPRPEVEPWLRRFTEKHYKSLSAYFAHLPPPTSRDGRDAMDIFHDTLLRLRHCPAEIQDYPAFERYALSKFHHEPGLTP